MRFRPRFSEELRLPEDERCLLSWLIIDPTLPWMFGTNESGLWLETVT